MSRRSGTWCRGAMFAAVLGWAAAAAAAPAGALAPNLGAAQSFGVVAGSTVTNTGGTILTGDLGVSPGTAVTGFPPGQFLAGRIHAADAAALAAQNSVMLAYNAVAAEECTANLTGQNLGGLTLTPGVYCFDTSAQLTGTLTLDGQGSSGALFIFKVGSTLITASGSSVNFIGNGSPCGVFWQSGSSVTLGSGSTFAGNILALSSITVTTGTTLTGRALARGGAVTLDSSTVTAPCAVVAPACSTITLTPPTIPNGTSGVPYSQLIGASGGTGPYTFSVESGLPPAGLALSPAGVLAGTPSTAASSTFTVRAVDANSCPGVLAYTMVVAPPVVTCQAITLSPGAAPNGTVGIAYSQVLTASGGTGPYTYSVSSGSPPPGMTLTTGGVLAGTPTSATTAAFTVRAVDVNSCAGTAPYTVVIAAAGCPAITLSPNASPTATVGIAYSQLITANGGSGPYTFVVTDGALPAGMTLTPAGLLAGTPTSAGTATFTVQASDANACLGSVVFTIVVAPAPATCPAISVSPNPAPGGTVGIAYLQALTASGGAGPYSFSVADGTLPAGMSLSTTGVLAGTPTTAGTANFNVRAVDANSCPGISAYAVVISAAQPGCPVITLTPASPPSGTIGLAYRQQFVGSGGTGPYTFTLVSGSLPVGLTLTAAGLLSGTPTSAGSSTFTVRGTDAGGCFGEAAVTMSIATAVPTLPQTAVVLLALGLMAAGYLRLRRPNRA